MNKTARRQLLRVANHHPGHRVALRESLQLDGSLDLNRLIRIASYNPELRSVLLPIIKEAAEQPGRSKGKATVPFLVWTMDAKDKDGGAKLQKRPGVRGSKPSAPFKWYVLPKILKEKLKKIDSRKRKSVMTVANRAGINAVKKLYKEWHGKNWEAPVAKGEKKLPLLAREAQWLETVDRVLREAKGLDKKKNKPLRKDKQKVEQFQARISNRIKSRIQKKKDKALVIQRKTEKAERREQERSKRKQKVEHKVDNEALNNDNKRLDKERQRIKKLEAEADQFSDAIKVMGLGEIDINLMTGGEAVDLLSSINDLVEGGVEPFVEGMGQIPYGEFPSRVKGFLEANYGVIEETKSAVAGFKEEIKSITSELSEKEEALGGLLSGISDQSSLMDSVEFIREHKEDGYEDVKQDILFSISRNFVSGTMESLLDLILGDLSEEKLQVMLGMDLTEPELSLIGLAEGLISDASEDDVSIDSYEFIEMANDELVRHFNELKQEFSSITMSELIKTVESAVAKSRAGAASGLDVEAALLSQSEELMIAIDRATLFVGALSAVAMDDGAPGSWVGHDRSKVIAGMKEVSVDVIKASAVSEGLFSISEPFLEGYGLEGAIDGIDLPSEVDVAMKSIEWIISDASAAVGEGAPSATQEQALDRARREQDESHADDMRWVRDSDDYRKLIRRLEREIEGELEDDLGVFDVDLEEVGVTNPVTLQRLKDIAGGSQEGGDVLFIDGEDMDEDTWEAVREWAESILSVAAGDQGRETVESVIYRDIIEGVVGLESNASSEEDRFSLGLEIVAVLDALTLLHRVRPDVNEVIGVLKDGAPSINVSRGDLEKIGYDGLGRLIDGVKGLSERYPSGEAIEDQIARDKQDAEDERMETQGPINERIISKFKAKISAEKEEIVFDKDAEKLKKKLWRVFQIMAKFGSRIFTYDNFRRQKAVLVFDQLQEEVPSLVVSYEDLIDLDNDGIRSIAIEAQNETLKLDYEERPKIAEVEVFHKHLKKAYTSEKKKNGHKSVRRKLVGLRRDVEGLSSESGRFYAIGQGSFELNPSMFEILRVEKAVELTLRWIDDHIELSKKEEKTPTKAAGVRTVREGIEAAGWPEGRMSFLPYKSWDESVSDNWYNKKDQQIPISKLSKYAVPGAIFTIIRRGRLGSGAIHVELPMDRGREMILESVGVMTKSYRPQLTQDELDLIEEGALTSENEAKERSTKEEKTRNIKASEELMEAFKFDDFGLSEDLAISAITSGDPLEMNEKGENKVIRYDYSGGVLTVTDISEAGIKGESSLFFELEIPQGTNDFSFFYEALLATVKGGDFDGIMGRVHAMTNYLKMLKRDKFYDYPISDSDISSKDSMDVPPHGSALFDGVNRTHVGIDILPDDFSIEDAGTVARPLPDSKLSTRAFWLWALDHESFVRASDFEEILEKMNELGTKFYVE